LLPVVDLSDTGCSPTLADAAERLCFAIETSEYERKIRGCADGLQQPGSSLMPALSNRSILVFEKAH
jgi:hypothetical protein